jgi:hypothetical protein
MIEQKQDNEIKLSPEINQQLQVLQVRISTSDMANVDLRKEMIEVLKALLNEVNNLQKENAELKAKQEKTSKS